MQIESFAEYISPYAKKLYKEILDNGYLSINSDTSDSDKEIANQLEEFGFVFRQQSAIGYDIFPIPINLLSVSLSHRLNWKYPPFHNIPNSQVALLVNALQEIRNKPSLSFKETTFLAQSLEGTNEIDSFIVRMLEKKDLKEICAVSAVEWSSNLPLVWTAILKQMRKGVQYRRIVTPTTLTAFGCRINNRDTQEVGVNLRVTITPTTSPFYLFLEEKASSALVFVPLANENDTPHATYTPISQLVKRFSITFENLWENAIPAVDILDFILKYRVSFIEKIFALYGENAKQVATTLFDEGIFANYTENDEMILSDLLRSNLAIKVDFKIGRTDFIPNIISAIEKYMRK